jgi:hypothetical protein
MIAVLLLVFAYGCGYGDKTQVTKAEPPPKLSQPPDPPQR